MMNVSACNIANKFEWKELYNTKDAYGINKFDTKGIRDFLVKLKTDDALWKKFFDYFYNQRTDCDKACRKQLICSLSNLSEQQFKECVEK